MVEPIAKASIVLSTSLVEIYAVPSGKFAQIPPLAFYNSGADATVTIEYIPSGDTDGQLKNQIAVLVPSGLTELSPFTKHLAAGGKVKVKATIASVCSAFIEPIERAV